MNRDLDVQCEDAAFKAKAAGQGGKRNAGTWPYNNLSELRAQTFICAEGKEGLAVLYRTQQDWSFRRQSNVQVTYHLPGAASTSQQPPQDIPTVRDQHTPMPTPVIVPHPSHWLGTELSQLCTLKCFTKRTQRRKNPKNKSTRSLNFLK